MAKYVWFNRLNQNAIEEVSCSMEWTIFKQRWQYLYYFGSINKPNSLDLPCIFWNYGVQQRHQYFTKKSLVYKFYIWDVWRYILQYKLLILFQILYTSRWHIFKVRYIYTICKRSTRWCFEFLFCFLLFWVKKKHKKI